METNLSKYQEDLDRLIDHGQLLYYSLALELNVVEERSKKQLLKIFEGKELPSFKKEYEAWYSEAMQVIKQVIPDRFQDFIRLYKPDKRKEINFLTYTISDHILGLTTRQYGEVIADGTAAVPKFEQQLSILKSAKRKFESSLFDIRQILQAELFDNELDSARELHKKGFLRGAGAIAGVVLETHLAQVCQNHSISIRKKHPAINDYNEKLKAHEVIDVPSWRRIQHLADLRNLCDHKKKREPTPEDIDELINGVEKVCKSIF